jgi:hypothetical protein
LIIGSRFVIKDATTDIGVETRRFAISIRKCPGGGENKVVTKGARFAIVKLKGEEELYIKAVSPNIIDST